ncbi:helix-turn-helix transcriptional regulator [Streptomyces sp. NBC_01310]|uniref:helix-turn-helix domain-containing protein n=1 Tax=unclassified Streptomyces TaxID=2593676 RepID=UPI002DDBE104|nr:helix-turn-helix transcriptional regulator [Streptomyces sp. NBC_01294]WRZ59879.1 helix-turn-helix transcriptional regulator [Streptomyces sp. NBC_01294]WSJ58515.1 helix-turn-helix transcriptional regulator [Streptomyces sp. NBC_01310]
MAKPKGEGGAAQTPEEFAREELRRHREGAGLTQEGLGERIFTTGSYVGQMECGQRRLRPEIAVLIDKELGTGDYFTRLSKAFKSKHVEYFAVAAELEVQATAIYEYCSSLVLGLLQTEDYARAVIRGGNPTALDAYVESLVASRIGRQRLLDDPATPELWVVLHEAVLRTVVGGHGVMAAQLGRIAAYVHAHRITLQVVPFSAGAQGTLGSLVTIMQFADAPDVVYTEGPRVGHLIDYPALVQRHWKLYDLARAAALAPAASLALIESVAEEHAICAQM